MEGDAKGQVGGMEMPQRERERLANESRPWKCHGCGGRSNEDILREEGGDAAKGKSAEPVVPEELKFGFRDELGNSSTEEAVRSDLEQKKVTAISNFEDKSTSRASQVTTAHAGITAATSSLASSPSAALPSRRTMQVGPPVRVPQSIPTATIQEPYNGVPPWVDKAITGLVAALALMVFKKILV